MSELWSQIDDYVSQCQMPDEFISKTSTILCNDCLKQSKTNFHFMYHKCQSCFSWNTTVLNVNDH